MGARADAAAGAAVAVDAEQQLWLSMEAQWKALTVSASQLEDGTMAKVDVILKLSELDERMAKLKTRMESGGKILSRGAKQSALPMPEYDSTNRDAIHVL